MRRKVLQVGASGRGFSCLTPLWPVTSSRCGAGQSSLFSNRHCLKCVVPMKLSCVSRVMLGRVGASGLALALGLVVGCGDDEGAGNTGPSASGDAAVGTSDTAESVTSGNQPGDTSDTSEEVTTDDEPPAPTPTTDSGNPVEQTGGEGSDGGSTCGGAGQECCAEATCNGGFVCVMGQQRPPAVDEDAGSLAFDGGSANQLAGDGGSLGVPPIDILPGTDAGLIAPPPPEQPEPAGMCEPCGSEDQRCCAQDACDDGFSCEASGFRPNGARSCVAADAPASDGGANASVDAAPGETCGGEGQTCCAGVGGQDPTCDDGLECNDPPGGGIGNSECTATASNGGADAGEACGGVDQPCCAGAGDGCEVGLECESNPPRGRDGDICVEP